MVDRKEDLPESLMVDLMVDRKEDLLEGQMGDQQVIAKEGRMVDRKVSP
jgi:hypothetical protein